MNRWKVIDRFDCLNQGAIDPTDCFQNVLMLLIQVRPVPDVLMMKYAIAKISDAVKTRMYLLPAYRASVGKHVEEELKCAWGPD